MKIQTVKVNSDVAFTKLHKKQKETKSESAAFQTEFQQNSKF